LRPLCCNTLDTRAGEAEGLRARAGGSRIYDDDAIMGDLPLGLRKEVSVQLFEDVVKSVPLFAHLSQATVQEICHRLTPLYQTMVSARPRLLACLLLCCNASPWCWHEGVSGGTRSDGPASSSARAWR
jgi:hypothetical protein